MWRRSERLRGTGLAALPVLLCFVLPVFAFKLNVPKALLPFSWELRVPCELEAEWGCCSW